MTQQQVLDSLGNILARNDDVLITSIPSELVSGLPREDQDAIKSCIGQDLTISGFDSHGNAEIEFIDHHGNPHTIWIRTDCLTKR